MKRGDLTLGAIVAAAADVADEVGLDALSLGAVAARLRVRAPSLYHHVDGLPALRRELSLRSVRELGEVLGRAAMGRAGVDAVAAVAQAMRDFARRRPGFYAAGVRALPRKDAEAARAGRAALAPFEAVLAGFGLKGKDAVHALRGLRSAVHGFVALEAAGGFGLPVDLDASYRWLVDTLASALAARAARRPGSR